MSVRYDGNNDISPITIQILDNSNYLGGAFIDINKGIKEGYISFK